MQKLGMCMQSATDQLNALAVPVGRPITFPKLAEGHYLVCGHGNPPMARLFIAETLQDMQNLYDGYQRGGGLTIDWYAVREDEISNIKLL